MSVTELRNKLKTVLDMVDSIPDLTKINGTSLECKQTRAIRQDALLALGQHIFHTNNNSQCLPKLHTHVTRNGNCTNVVQLVKSYQALYDAAILNSCITDHHSKRLFSSMVALELRKQKASEYVRGLLVSLDTRVQLQRIVRKTHQPLDGTIHFTYHPMSSFEDGDEIVAILKVQNDQEFIIPRDPVIALEKARIYMYAINTMNNGVWTKSQVLALDVESSASEIPVLEERKRAGNHSKVEMESIVTELKRLEKYVSEKKNELNTELALALERELQCNRRLMLDAGYQYFRLDDDDDAFETPGRVAFMRLLDHTATGYPISNLDALSNEVNRLDILSDRFSTEYRFSNTVNRDGECPSRCAECYAEALASIRYLRKSNGSYERAQAPYEMVWDNDTHAPIESEQKHIRCANAYVKMLKNIQVIKRIEQMTQYCDPNNQTLCLIKVCDYLLESHSSSPINFTNRIRELDLFYRFHRGFAISGPKLEDAIRQINDTRLNRSSELTKMFATNDDDGVLVCMTNGLDQQSILNLMKTCSTMAKSDCLKQRLPHLSWQDGGFFDKALGYGSTTPVLRKGSYIPIGCTLARSIPGDDGLNSYESITCNKVFLKAELRAHLVFDHVGMPHVPKCAEGAPLKLSTKGGDKEKVVFTVTHAVRWNECSEHRRQVAPLVVSSSYKDYHKHELMKMISSEEEAVQKKEPGAHAKLLKLRKLAKRNAHHQHFRIEITATCESRNQPGYEFNMKTYSPPFILVAKRTLKNVCSNQTKRQK